MERFDLFRLNRRVLLVLSLLCCTWGAAWADETPDDPASAADRELPDRVVSGLVSDVQGNPLVGATIVVKDAPTMQGTITGPDGRFSLKVPARSTLVITYVGFKSLRFPVLNRTELDIVLEEETERLDNVVVVGYGTQEKSDLTGSIASIKASDIKDTPARSVAEALQGKVAGVMVTKTSGKPGASSDIVIRGVGSINGLNPLFVIDGVACENNTDYNLNDIESIEVIKDASAAAIYGSRAAGGVVLITTKKGTYNSKARLAFTSHVGVRQYTDMYRMLGTEDYIRVMQEMGFNYPIWSDPSSLPDTDWVSEIYQPGIEQSYNLSLTGGSERFRYYLSGAYERENGIQMNNYWERISSRLNVDYRVAPSLTVGTRIYLARLRGNPYTESFPWVSIPYMSIYDESGDFAAIPSGIDFSGANPVADIAYHHRKQSDLVANGDLYIDWEIVKGLKLNLTGSAQLGGGYDDNFSEANTLGRSPSKDSYTKALDYAEQYTFTATLSYERLFAGKHDLRVMVGYEAKRSQLADLSSTASDFPINNPESFALSTNPTKSASGALSEDRFLSQFARLNYTYDNRYLLTMNVRRDGSPKFGPKHRWGVFPSVSVGWKISEEPFFRAWNPSWVSMIKPRFSWGILGNDQALNSFAYMAAFQNVTSHSFDGTSAVGGYNNIKVINEDIRWESIYTTDVGLDVDLFRNRLSISFDWYRRITRDMIYALSVPNSSGITSPSSLTTMSTMPVNLGRIDNHGWELLVNYRNNIGYFNYAIGANVSQNRNRVVDLGLTNAAIYGGGGHPNEGPSPCKTVNGQPISQFWGLKTDGMITSQEEIDALNARAQANGYDYYHQRLTGVGDLRYVDMNGDGTINDDDCTFIGNPWPTVQYGFNLSFEWRGIDFRADFTGVAGNDVLNLAKSYTQSVQESSNTTSEIFGASFFMGNGLTDRPRVMALDASNGNVPVKDPNYNYQKYSDYFIEDGSYLRLRTVTLGYTFPRRWTRRAKIDRLRIYVSATNLWTLTGFTGLDPEFSNTTKTAYGVYYGSTYPQTRMFSFGLDLNF